MEKYDMTVKKFADNYLPSDTKIKVVKSCEIVFDGTLDELYYYGDNTLNLIVAMIGAEENKVCLSCRNC